MNTPKLNSSIVLGALACAGLFCLPAGAADLLSVLPVTDRILCLHYDDGHIDYAPTFGKRNENVLYYDLLDTAAAVAVSRYTLTSADDAAYAAGRAPDYAARKSKGAEFHTKFFGATVQYLSEHWVYLRLPEPLKAGKRYSLAVNGLADNGREFAFTFDGSLRSPTIHVSQAGFLPEAPKFAYLSQWMGDYNLSPHLAGGLELDDYAGAAFRVVDDATGASVFTGTVAKRSEKTKLEITTTVFGPSRNFSKTDVWEADFSALTTPGRYRVVVDRMGCSYPFTIEADPFRKAFHASMKGLFLMRCGILREVEPGTEYPRCHNNAQSTVKYYYDPAYKFWINSSHGLGGFDWVTRPVTAPVYGGYHDAGDWDTYVYSHATVPLALLVLYDLSPEKFSDGEVANRYKVDPAGPWIEEGGNGVPDVLDEARWYVDFLRRVRDAIKAAGYGTGGTTGYARRDAGADMGSWQDSRQMAITAEDPVGTYLMAASIAFLADTLQQVHARAGGQGQHPEYATLRQEAVDAYAWSNAYLAANPADSNDKVPQPKMAAAAALYRLTGEASYQADFISLYDNSYGSKGNSLWVGFTTGALAEFIYLSIDAGTPGLDTAKQDAIHSAVANRANSSEVANAALRSFRLGFDAARSIDLGMFTTPTSIFSAVAHAYTGGTAYSDLLHHRAAYSLGGNNLNLSYLTGVGQERERAVFLPDEWSVMNVTSMAYRIANWPGMSAYFKAGDSAFNVTGDGDERWSDSTGYPAVVRPSSGNWPYAELRFFNRNSIAGSEFTVHQQNVVNAFMYGYLTQPRTAAFVPNTPPTVSIGLADGATLSRNGPVALTVSASADTVRVQYFYEWHYIGESRDAANGFRLVWDPTRCELPAKTGIMLTAIAYDADGEPSRHTAATDALVQLADIPYAGSPWIAFTRVQGYVDTAEQGAPGFGWIDEQAWPWVYSFAVANTFAGSGAGWLYVPPQGASLQGLAAYVFSAGTWIWLSPLCGAWYYNYSNPSSGQQGWSQLAL